MEACCVCVKIVPTEEGFCIEFSGKEAREMMAKCKEMMVSCCPEGKAECCPPDQKKK